MQEKILDNKRLQYIDIAKGIAMICIILGHMGNANINRVVFTFHVPIFFFITGYFISDKCEVNIFVRNKVRTLIIPYLITCFAIVIIATLQGAICGDAIVEIKKWSYASVYGAGDSYTNPFYIPGIGAIWFLLATFWGSIFLRISLNFNKYIRLFSIAVIFAIGYYSRKLFWFPLSIQAGACATLFMYMGNLLNLTKDILKEIPNEVKKFGIGFAMVTWYFFIKDFQSFWLVHCDIGRGIVDIFGSMCACAMVILISRTIEIKTKKISNVLAYLGRYSLLILCVHVIELNLVQWWKITDKIIIMGGTEEVRLVVIIICKLILDLGITYILSKITFVRRIFGYKN